MGEKANITIFDDHLMMRLHLGRHIDWAVAAPETSYWNSNDLILLEWDAQKLADGVWELVGMMILALSKVSEQDLEELGKLDLPRVDVTELGLTEAEIADVVRAVIGLTGSETLSAILAD
jgi:hypothetical protein